MRPLSMKRFRLSTFSYRLARISYGPHSDTHSRRHRQPPSEPQPSADHRPLEVDRADAQKVIAAVQLPPVDLQADGRSGARHEGVAEVAQIDLRRDDQRLDGEEVGAIGEVE